MVAGNRLRSLRVLVVCFWIGGGRGWKGVVGGLACVRRDKSRHCVRKRAFHARGLGMDRWVTNYTRLEKIMEIKTKKGELLHSLVCYICEIKQT